jgi:hypothetical protein
MLEKEPGAAGQNIRHSSYTRCSGKFARTGLYGPVSPKHFPLLAALRCTAQNHQSLIGTVEHVIEKTAVGLICDKIGAKQDVFSW